jgi:NADPH:quinone reductase-like Zn-dependent oxidoreductase
VNPIDLKVKSGEFKAFLKYKFPLILGNDLSGIVTQVGTGVTKFKVGDAVYGIPSNATMGAFAQQIAVNAADLSIKPSNLSMEQAAAVPLVSLTAMQALMDIAKLKRGQKVLIHAGSGGVGTVAIQLAKLMGAYVATTTSTANVELVKSLGADQVIDYKKEEFEAKLKDFDVVLNSLDAQTLKKSVSVLKPGGHLISISGPPTPASADQMGLNWVMKQIMRMLSYSIRHACKKTDISYTFLFMQANGEQLAQITNHIESGAIRPVIDRAFAFEQTNEAMAYVDSGRAKGKVVIKVRN